MSLIFSVGRWRCFAKRSPNIGSALELVKRVSARIFGIVGRDGGDTARSADVCLILPTVNEERITPHGEPFQAVVWHGLVSHPSRDRTKWESIQ